VDKLWTKTAKPLIRLFIPEQAIQEQPIQDTAG